jgi:hypothetical protein
MKSDQQAKECGKLKNISNFVLGKQLGNFHHKIPPLTILIDSAQKAKECRNIKNVTNSYLGEQPRNFNAKIPQ